MTSRIASMKQLIKRTSKDGPFAAGLMAFAERLSFSGEFGVAQGRDDRLMPVDLGDHLAVLLDQPVVTAA